MTTAHWSTTTLNTGAFTTIVRAGTVLASGWTEDPEYLLALINSELRPDELLRVDDLGVVTTALLRYDEGDLAAIDEIPVRQLSGPFVTHAWDVLRKVTPGAQVTYAELAERAGKGSAHRAAAATCARNAAALFVPCHRVQRRDGSLGGFRYGLERKAELIAHEAKYAKAAAA
ncbi:cysteine methyltransferase [Williamsia sp. Leaf354]|jgi:methylated-DNA-[protein]-cysteine S-methyltransferase|uniref:methylated-DNA--[protein]-cysteine S-methyltransferase n=1 Tax=Williamsia sp. Leaf354 TaxID=1736349 RepID=UPI0006FC14BE|nr:methylated-DNA--[protein]-cysteine S-methyltransferase [Williamsia sp. Leaf354]KQR98118.1 cysteine methyltransferase [Williamsia sp. Leaf354]